MGAVFKGALTALRRHEGKVVEIDLHLPTRGSVEA